MAAGPISALYLTAGDQQHIDVIQGNSVINQFNEVHSAEYPIAVNTTVRTLASAFLVSVR